MGYNTDLIKAVENKDDAEKLGTYVSEIKRLLDLGADSTHNGCESIKLAIKNGDLNLVKLLIGDKKIENRFYDEFLFLAIKIGNIDLCKYFIDKRATIHIFDKQSALNSLFRKDKGFEEIIKLLITNGSFTIQETVNASIEHNNQKVFDMLIDEMYYIDDKYLIYAIKNNNAVMVNKILDKGANINCSYTTISYSGRDFDHENYTLQEYYPLRLAVEKGCLDITKILFERKAIVTGIYYSELVFNAINSKKIDLVRYVMEIIIGKNFKHYINNKYIGTGYILGNVAERIARSTLEIVKYFENQSAIDIYSLLDISVEEWEYQKINDVNNKEYLPRIHSQQILDYIITKAIANKKYISENVLSKFIEQNDIEMVNKLLDSNLVELDDIYFRDIVKNGYIDMCKLLFNRCPKLISFEVFDLAYEFNQVEIFKEVSTKLGFPGIEFLKIKSSHITPERFAIIKYLLETKIVNIHDKHDFLFRQACRGYEELFDLCIEYGADIHAKNDAAIRKAKIYQSPKIVDRLIKLGVDIKPVHIDTALEKAVKSGNVDKVKKLIDEGECMVQEKTDALRLSLESINNTNRMKIAKLLIRKGADIHYDNDVLLKLKEKNNAYSKLKPLVDRELKREAKNKKGN